MQPKSAVRTRNYVVKIYVQHKIALLPLMSLDFKPDGELFHICLSERILCLSFNKTFPVRRVDKVFPML
jgi:hypothetical protein